MRTLVFGALVGALLGLVHAPLGLDLLQLQALEPGTAFAWRGLALGLVALAAASARTALPHPFPPARLAAGLLLGWLAVRLLLDPWTELETRTALWAAGIGLAAATVAVGRVGGSAEPPSSHVPEGPDPWAVTGLAVCGAGLALGLNAVARWVRHFGAGRPADDAAAGLVLLALVLAGVVCFRDVVRALGLAHDRARFVSTAGLTALAAAGSVVALAFLSRIATRETLEPFLRSLGSSPERHGQWDYALLVAARGFAVPGLALGTALAAVRHRGELAALAAGAAAAHFALPALVARFADRALDPSEAGALACHSGALLALIGTALVLVTRRERDRRAWALGVVTAATAVGLAVFLPRPAVRPLSPWQLVRPEQELDRATPAGLLSVEWARGFSEVLAVDRRRVTPTTEEEEADRQQLRLSLGLLPEAVLERGARVLLLGQLTPSRDRVLRTAGLARVDRSAPWWRSFEVVEATMFHGAAPLDGEHVPPHTARERIAEGHYDLVVAPAVRGVAPVVPSLAAGGDTVVVVWLDAASGAAKRAWGEGVLLASDALMDWTIGCVAGPVDPRRAGQAEGLFEADRADLALLGAGGRRRGAPALVELQREPFFRSRASQRACARRLAEGAEGPRATALTRGLVAWFEAQRRSAHWDQRAASLEVAPEALAAFSEAACLPEPPDAVLAHLWERLARVLVEKREIQMVFDHLEPVALAHPFWPELESALARADLEFLDAASAATRLQRLADVRPLDIDLRLAAARALSMAGLHAEAAHQLRMADALQPERRDVRRELAMAMVRAGEAGGRALVQELLDADPGDHALEPFLGPGPFPPVETTFQVGGEGHFLEGEEAGHGAHGHDHGH